MSGNSGYKCGFIKCHEIDLPGRVLDLTTKPRSQKAVGEALKPVYLNCILSICLIEFLVDYLVNLVQRWLSSKTAYLVVIGTPGLYKAPDIPYLVTLHHLTIMKETVNLELM